jgi:pantothenate kinase
VTEVTDGPGVVADDPSMLAGLVRQHATRTGSSRLIVGITGGPGSGKSTLAARLVEQLAMTGDGAVLVPMDGFHLAQSVLKTLDLVEVQGAPDTFDAAGYVALLQRIRAVQDEIVYAPAFLREIEEPIAGTIPVLPGTRYVVTEGNYLLLDRSPWSRLRAELDAIWFLEPSEDIRINRLVRRHIQFGRTPNQALRRATTGSDAENAVLIAPTRNRADLIITV